MYVQSVKSIYLYFRFLEKSCQYCDFRAETGSNERYGNFTFYVFTIGKIYRPIFSFFKKKLSQMKDLVILNFRKFSFHGKPL